MLRRLSVLLVLTSMAGAVAGCADGDVKEANAYVGAVNEAQQSFAARSERLQSQISPDTPSQADQRVLRRFYAAVDGFVGQLRAIEPPARVKSLHERLIAAMARFGTTLRSAGAAISSGKPGRILDGQEQLAKATAGVSKTINRTIAAINAALKK